MGGIRRSLAAVVALNTAVFAGEAIAGFQANSISLIMDAVHNSSDELALICLFLAYMVTVRLSRNLQRAANILNSLGLMLVSLVIVWQAAERVMDPAPVVGWLPVAVGLAAAAGNWGIARLLRPWQASSVAIRLAYLHNLGDVYVSLLPVLAGVLVLVTGWSFFDPVLAGAVALWIMYATVQEVRKSGNDLLWPEDVAVAGTDERIEVRGA